MHRVLQLGIAGELAGDGGVDGEGRRPARMAGNDFGEGLHRRVHHRRVEGMRGVQGRAAHAFDLQAAGQRIESLMRAGHHAELRGIEAGQIHACAEPGLDGGFGEAHRHHSARRHSLHELGAGGDDLQRVLQREDAGNGGSGKLTDAVADQGRRLRTPAQPELGQGIAHREDGWLGQLGGADFFGRVFGGAEQDAAQVFANQAQHDIGAGIELLPEHGLAGIQGLGHARVLRALAREHPHQGGRGMQGAAGDELADIAAIAEDGNATAGQAHAAHVEGVGGVGPLCRSGVEHGLGHRASLLLQGGIALGREPQQLPGPCGRRGFNGPAFFQQRMKIGAAEAEGADTGAAREGRIPVAQCSVHCEGAELDVWVGLGKMQARRQLPVV